MPDLVLEIGCEEIPARMIDAASLELRDRVHKLLEREHLSATGPVSSLDSPRRIAVLASGIPEAQADVTEQVTGPSANVAFKDGQPTPAAHAFEKKAVPQPKFFLSCSLKRSTRFTGQRICMGASRAKSSCGRSGGLWLCSTQ